MERARANSRELQYSQITIKGIPQPDKKVAVVLLGTVLMVLIPPTRDLILGVLAEAYWQVTSYVASTLFLFYWLQTKLSDTNSIARLIRTTPTYQILFASTMGVLPGCGGAIIIMTQFVKGRASFGSVVAVLTATMGDAAFLLFSAKPHAGFFILAVSFFVAMATGLIVDTIHGRDFLRIKMPIEHFTCDSDVHPESNDQSIHWEALFWKLVLIPTACIAFAISCQVDVESICNLPTGSLKNIGAGLALMTLLLGMCGGGYKHKYCSQHPDDYKHGVFGKVATETNYVTSWVIAGFLLFEVLMRATGFEVGDTLTGMPAAVIFIAVLVGCIPGCGPQILVTTLFINGVIPMSAQLGNAISNDGDALFPALALAPRAALMATFYSTIPALLTAFTYLFLCE